MKTRSGILNTLAPNASYQDRLDDDSRNRRRIKQLRKGKIWYFDEDHILSSSMNIGKTFYASERQSWRSWLQEHYKSEQEIWLIFHRKKSGKPNVSYNDAVEEALCFGWIDSIRKGLDESRLAHRFTPRKRGSGFSQTNIERLRRLIAQEKVADELLDEVHTVLEGPFDYPEDIMKALQADNVAWENFNKYSESYQRIRIAFVNDGRKREGEYEKRLANLLKKTKANKQYGYGIEPYY